MPNSKGTKKSWHSISRSERSWKIYELKNKQMNSPLVLALLLTPVEVLYQKNNMGILCIMWLSRVQERVFALAEELKNWLHSLLSYFILACSIFSHLLARPPPDHVCHTTATTTRVVVGNVLTLSTQNSLTHFFFQYRDCVFCISISIVVGLHSHGATLYDISYSVNTNMRTEKMEKYL